ncbi:FAD binding domain-containing protein [Streptomyces sp. NPDC051561]|uniref:FAD binding domain-containing protein n=1 Tax=Streptomyces sp. NPDC051561 TaxID=3365658 RepID=UPI00379DABAA
MKDFGYQRAADVAAAVAAVGPGTKFLAGGTNLVDLMREGVETPDALIDVSRLPLTGIDALPGGGLRIGALTSNSQLAAHPLVRTRYPVLAQAVLSGASGQLRNMATVGGNLLQRTRCSYFTDHATRCNKRSPGSGCDAIDGFHRTHAVLGTSAHCIAAHPSDMAVALVALDAVVEAVSVRGTRYLPLAGFHRLPGRTPHEETELAPDELITAVELPALSAAANSRYRKVRDRASYAFALVSVAVALEVDRGMVSEVRIGLGGIGTVPWRARGAERVLLGATAGEESYRRAAHTELAPAGGRPQNAFKVELVRRVLVSTLCGLTEGGAG